MSLHIAIIGGGASGMMAAVAAARAGASVTLLERQDRIGRKLLATGNGRCNLTNVNLSVANYHGTDPAFAMAVIGRFPAEKTVSFFNDLGLCTKIEEKGKVFPVTGQASTVLDILRMELERLKADVRPSAHVRNVRKQGEGFAIGDLKADRVIVAAGGMAAPQLGGCADGMDLLKKLGHSPVDTCPALVPLKTNAKFMRHLKGIKVNAEARLQVSGRAAGWDSGEILFTDYGLSGPPIIQLSLLAAQALAQSKPVQIVLDLFPDRTEDDLAGELSRRLSARPAEVALVGLIHKRIAQVVLEETSQAENLAIVLKRWKFPVTGTLPYREAQLMAGGISTQDFDPSTLESKRVRGLFACGEVLDVSGDCGGYNLHWAWSSGFIAGKNATKPA